jgi:hypothetical protein
MNSKFWNKPCELYQLLPFISKIQTESIDGEFWISIYIFEMKGSNLVVVNGLAEAGDLMVSSQV